MTAKGRLQTHRLNQAKNGFSEWYVWIRGRKRLVTVQEYRGILYVVGCVYSGLSCVIEFEEPLSHVVKRYGDVLAKVGVLQSRNHRGTADVHNNRK